MLHPTSLPGGRLGADAYAFVDWLQAAGQSWWQMLPLGPPDDVGSPYASSSAFAAWSGLLADPDAPVTTAELDAFRKRTATGSRTGSGPAAASPIRSGSSASGRRCARTRTSGASA